MPTLNSLYNDLCENGPTGLLVFIILVFALGFACGLAFVAFAWKPWERKVDDKILEQ